MAVSVHLLFSSSGRYADMLLDLCLRIKEKFQLSWKMVSLVYAILKNTRDNQDEAFRQIEEGKCIVAYL